VTIGSISDDTPVQAIDIPWTVEKTDRHNHSSLLPVREPDQKLLQALARAHAWMSDLANDRFASVEDLASNADIHPKVMREALKLAFVAPDIVTSIFTGVSFELAALRKVSALSWHSQLQQLHQAKSTRFD
jgi:site-specific DNA recombinase